jgi:F-type H+-transporting ATPase subunit epsilon
VVNVVKVVNETATTFTILTILITLTTFYMMNLVILSPEKEIFAGEVKSVIVPGAEGQFEMLENHAAIVSSLKSGEVKVTKANGEKVTFGVEGGFAECLHNEVSLLVSSVK